MKTRFHQALIVCLFFTASAISGCHENTIINANVAPTNNSVGVFDTSLSCITHTYYNDTVLTSIKLITAIGALEEPFFGTMTASTFFQVVPQDLSSGIFTDQTIDSAELILPYTGFTYGDTSSSATQTYQVFYVTDTLGYNTPYYAYSSKPIDATYPLSDPTAIDLHHLSDSLSIKGQNYGPGARIKLKLPALLNRLLPAVSGLSTASPVDYFINSFKGISVRVADTRHTIPSMPYFFLEGTGSFRQASILVYYHANSFPDTAVIEKYYFNSQLCTNINNISKSYSHFPVNDLFHSIQANDSVVGLQNLPGANIDIVIPGIKKLPKGIINKADIQLTLLPGSHNPSAFAQPTTIGVIGIGNGSYPVGVNYGANYFVADRYPLASLSPYAILDGQLHTYTTAGGVTLRTYTIGIPREVMASIAAGNDTLHLHISGSNDFLGSYHLVAGGGSYPDSLYRAKLNVVYSILNH